MVKQVPLTTELNQTLDAGSAVQFTGGSVEPMQNKMPGQIQKQSTALLQTQKTAQALADELNDAEATRLYNEFFPELENNYNAYTDLTGFDAVAPIPPDTEGGEFGNTLDVYKNKNLETLRDKYREKASNGSVQFMFEAKAHQAIADSQNKMTQHSIKQQKIGAENALNDHLEVTKKEIVNDYEKWNVDGSVYQTRKFVGMALIDEIAMVNDWNIDPTKGRVSSQYLELRSKYLYEVSTAVLKKMKLAGISPEQRGKYINKYYGDFGEKTADKLLEINEKEGKLNKVSACVEATLRDNGNTNDGSYISTANRMYCLSSSNAFDNGKGASVTQGLHSDKVDTTEKSISDNMNMAEQLLHTGSKFYKPDSKLNGTLLNQHKTTHMFAALHLGVEKADSLYTKAKSQVDIDPKQFKNNPVYAKNINSQIITNYKNLIIEEANKEFRPEIVRLEKEIEKLENTPDVYKRRISSNLGPFPGTDDYEKLNKDEKKKRKIKQLKNQLAIQKETEDSGFAEKIANDLNILEGEIDYDYDPQITKELEIDEVSGLQPLNVLIRKLQATIKDPKELQAAVKELKVKYDDITNASNELYNENFKKATTIAIARENGHEDLIENGIDIKDFKEEDQQKLINGQPENSDIDTLLMLERNPEELKNNLYKNIYRMNKKDLMKLEEYAAKLDTDQKIVAVKIETDMLDMELKLAGFDKQIDDESNDEEVKQNYLEIKEEWRKRIDEAQIENGGKTIGREAKRAILRKILNDQVLTGKTTDKFLGIFGGKPEFQPLSTVNQYKGNDDLPTTDVIVHGEKIRLSKIPEYQRKEIIKTLNRRNDPVTEYAIAEFWVDAGKSTATNPEEQLIFKANKGKIIKKRNEKIDEKLRLENELKNVRRLGYF